MCRRQALPDSMRADRESWHNRQRYASALSSPYLAPTEDYLAYVLIQRLRSVSIFVHLSFHQSLFKLSAAEVQLTLSRTLERSNFTPALVLILPFRTFVEVTYTLDSDHHGCLPSDTNVPVS
jgi:hypothetical protein